MMTGGTPMSGFTSISGIPHETSAPRPGENDPCRLLLGQKTMHLLAASAVPEKIEREHAVLAM